MCFYFSVNFSLLILNLINAMCAAYTAPTFRNLLRLAYIHIPENTGLLLEVKADLRFDRWDLELPPLSLARFLWTARKPFSRTQGKPQQGKNFSS